MRKIFIVLALIALFVICIIPCFAANTTEFEEVWVEDPIVLLDIEFAPGGKYEGIGEKVVENINKELGFIQLQIEYSEEDMGFAAFVYPLIYNGVPAQEAIERYNQHIQYQDLLYPNTIRVTIDPAASGFTGGGPYRIYTDNGQVNFHYIGKVTLDSQDFDKLLTTQFAWFQDEYGATYEAEDVLTHELLHALKIPHVYGPYMKVGFFDNQAASPQAIKYQYIQPLMNPDRTSNAYGLTETDRNLIYRLYGAPENRHAVDFTLLYNGVEAIGMNIVLLPVIPSNIAEFKFKEDTIKPVVPYKTLAKKKATYLRDRAIAKSTLNGVTNVFVKTGKYKIQVRNVSTKGGSFSGVEGEKTTPSFTGTKYVTKGPCGYTYTDDPKKATTFIINKDKSFLIENEKQIELY